MSMILLAAALLLAPQSTLVEGTARSHRLSYDNATEVQKKLLAEFDPADASFAWSMREVRASERTIQYEVRFPSPVQGDVVENNSVVARYWVAKDARPKRPAVVVLHWLGGSFDALILVCEKLAERGLATLLVYMPHYGPRRAEERERRQKMVSGDLEATRANMRQAVLDVRRAHDWLAARPEVDASRIGIFGVSLGAVISGLTAGIDTRFRPACFLIGGGDLAGIVLHGSKDLREVKQKVEELGLAREEIAERWRAVDPLTFASRLDRATTLMINAENDEIIPRAATERLWEAIGRPRILWHRAGHYTIILQIAKILDQVIAHFLPEPSGPPLRVLLAEDAADIELDLPGACDVLRPDSARPLEARVDFGKVSAHADQGIHVGSRVYREPRIALKPEGSFRLGGRTYEGTLHLVAADKGALHAVLELDLERYVAGVVGPEIGPSAPLEAMKAQAVAARTYAWVRREQARASALFDVYADARDQVFGGAPPRESAMEKAALATAGQLLTAGGQPFPAFFHSTCGGATASAGDIFGVKIAPLEGADCGYCAHARNFAWTLSLPREELGFALRGLASEGLRDLRVGPRSARGRVLQVVVVGTDGRESTLDATELREALGPERLRSTSFDVARDGDAFVFKGNGWGHGVGLCQEGAIGMAKAGQDWRAILGRYYSGAALRALYGASAYGQVDTGRRPH